MDAQKQSPTESDAGHWCTNPLYQGGVTLLWRIVESDNRLPRDYSGQSSGLMQESRQVERCCSCSNHGCFTPFEVLKGAMPGAMSDEPLRKGGQDWRNIVKVTQANCNYTRRAATTSPLSRSIRKPVVDRRSEVTSLFSSSGTNLSWNSNP